MDILNEEFLSFLRCASQNRLRYMLIGGYAVNYYGYNRNTDDMDVWIAPTAENKKYFIQTLLCMKYSENEVAPLQNEDFTIPFVGHFGTLGNNIDVLTVVHHSLSYEEAEKDKNVFEIEPDVFMNIVPYDFLQRMKLIARRPKDYLDLSELDKLRNKNKS
jgi:hypothetical protein